jgi:hypothetical protein
MPGNLLITKFPATIIKQSSYPFTVHGLQLTVGKNASSLYNSKLKLAVIMPAVVIAVN